MMMRFRSELSLIAGALVLSAAILWAGCNGFPDLSSETALGRTRAGFVATRGTEFVIDGREIRFMGANMGGIQALWESDSRDMEANAEAIVRAAARCCNLLRVWAFGDGASREPEPFEALMNFRMGPERRLSHAYRVLDHIVAAAGRQGVKVTLVLSNFWADFGGIRRYHEWYNLPPAAPYSRPERATPSLEQATFFFVDERAREAYRSHVRSIVRRVNLVTGLRYADDPAIMSYELMNELRPVEGLHREQYRWVHEMSSYIKTLDPHHLVSSGFDDPHSWPEGWIHSGRIPNVDYLDVHLYPAAAPSPQEPVHGWSSLWEFLRRTAAESASNVRKPLILGEFNFPEASYPAFGFASHYSARMAVSRVLERTVKELGFGGASFWYLNGVRAVGPLLVNPSIPRDAEFLRRVGRVRDALPR